MSLRTVVCVLSHPGVATNGEFVVGVCVANEEGVVVPKANPNDGVAANFIRVAALLAADSVDNNNCGCGGFVYDVGGVNNFGILAVVVDDEGVDVDVDTVKDGRILFLFL